MRSQCPDQCQLIEQVVLDPQPFIAAFARSITVRARRKLRLAADPPASPGPRGHRGRVSATRRVDRRTRSLLQHVARERDRSLDKAAELIPVLRW